MVKSQKGIIPKIQVYMEITAASKQQTISLHEDTESCKLMNDAYILFLSWHVGPLKKVHLMMMTALMLPVRCLGNYIFYSDMTDFKVVL